MTKSTIKNLQEWLNERWDIIQNFGERCADKAYYEGGLNNEKQI